MADPVTTLAAAALIGLAMVAAALLHAWQGWLALKRQELGHGGAHAAVAVPSPSSLAASGEGSALGAARIELADLRERIRKLEAIAAGVDL